MQKASEKAYLPLLAPEDDDNDDDDDDDGEDDDDDSWDVSGTDGYTLNWLSEKNCTKFLEKNYGFML